MPSTACRTRKAAASELINPNSKAGQDDFLDAIQHYKYTLFGGGAGPGKSYVLR